ncbi:MAG: hypothetical protein FJ148_12335 [Deltaproteobacteria bacterium]|nr:hypothetical protein [Deltaproteobacteria bacterium]
MSRSGRCPTPRPGFRMAATPGIPESRTVVVRRVAGAPARCAACFPRSGLGGGASVAGAPPRIGRRGHKNYS